MLNKFVLEKIKIHLYICTKKQHKICNICPLWIQSSKAGDNINKHIGDGNENVTNDNRNVNKEEGFELTDTLADDFHRLF